MDDNMRNAWLDMISKVYSNLHNSDRVLKASNVSDKKRERLLKYFERLEELHNKVSETKSVNGEKLLKSFYYDLYVIKPENIPDAYFQNQVRLARERGYGNIELTEEDKRRMTEEVIDDQKKSLDKWIEYFLYDEESKSYEMWEKYWVFQGLQNLGKYDKETSKFSKRDKSTVYPFPPVEREYIFTTLKLMEDFLKDKKGEEDIKQALSTGNFKLLYEYVIKQSFLKGEHQSNSTDGKWIKYEQGSDYNILRDSLQGYYTGWCTAAGENFAKDQLAGGDFYVYYSLDENGEAKVPRIAIRMDGKDKIGEIRGIADNQNMEPEMMSILEEKLKEFPDRDKYLKKENDMKLLTLIDKKVNDNIDLTLEELKFLYEIDGQIIGFGYRKDPRIEEIKRKRNERKDYSLIFNVKEEEVALSQKEWLNNPEKFKALPGSIDSLYLTSAEGLVLPQLVGGNIELRSLASAEGLVLPKSIGGDIDLRSLASAEGLVLPESIGGKIYLNSLTSAEGLVLPQHVRGINLSSLASAEGLVLPESIGGSIDLRSLTSAEGLVLPKSIGGSIDLRSLTSAEGLVLPKSIGGKIYLNSLTSAEGLVLPKSIGGDIFLDSLTSAEGLVLPESIGDDILLRSLASAEGLVLPESIGGSIFLSSLTSAEGLVLPKSIGRHIDLRSLTSAEGLVLPQHVGGGINLSSLTSAEGLVLPQHVGDYIELRSLTSAEGLVLPQHFGGYIDLRSLTSAEGLVLPQHVRDINLSSLTSADGLVLPQHVGGYIDLNSLTSAEGLVLPHYFNLNKLKCPDNIKEEIMNNPDKYYMAPTEEDKKGIKK
jgi:predicted regulator of Ras-like GTPase activity (Roadblock/LC7/MglB family)